MLDGKTRKGGSQRLPSLVGHRKGGPGVNSRVVTAPHLLEAPRGHSSWARASPALRGSSLGRHRAMGPGVPWSGEESRRVHFWGTACWPVTAPVPCQTLRATVQEMPRRGHSCPPSRAQRGRGLLASPLKSPLSGSLSQAPGGEPTEGTEPDSGAEGQAAGSAPAAGPEPALPSALCEAGARSQPQTRLGLLCTAVPMPSRSRLPPGTRGFSLLVPSRPASSGKARL